MRVCEARLLRTDLTSANLTGTDLGKARLSEAILSHADLRNAELAGAKIGDTIFANTDIGYANGLEDVRHEGPSSIGIDTIYRSKGKIPESFLRGWGVPDNFIGYMDSLAGAAFEFYSCFISYSTREQDFADRLAPICKHAVSAVGSRLTK